MTRSPYVSAALHRLQKAVTICCWIVAVALTLQVLVWCFATFTEVRHKPIASETAKTPVVQDPAVAAPTVQIKAAPSTISHATEPVATDPNQALTWLDPVFGRISTIALAGGTFAALVLLPLLMFGTLLGVCSMTAGFEEALKAFMWYSAMAALILPFGHVFGLPWHGGALMDYDYMTRQVEMALIGSAWGGGSFYARFALLPLACIAGIAMVGCKFSNGVRAGIMPRAERLDPELEKETASIRPGSLHGGRNGHAIRAAGVINEPIEAAPIAQAVAGVAPRRLI